MEETGVNLIIVRRLPNSTSQDLDLLFASAVVIHKRFST